MKVAILDDYQDAVRKLNAFRVLDGLQVKIHTNNVKGLAQLSARLRDTEALVLIRGRTAISASLLERLPNLKLVVQTGAVGPHVDVAACTRRGVLVCDGPSAPYAAAELTWALTMAAMRRLPQYVNHLKHGIWQHAGLRSHGTPDNFGLGTRLRGKTLGIWGYGRIGSLVADYGRAFGMAVLVWGSQAARERAAQAGHHTAASPEALFTQADVLSLHLRLSDATRGVVTPALLASMKPTALLVNTARAELVVDGALLGALNRGRPGMAAIDVYESEPLLRGNALLQLENCVCTPHIGYVEQENYESFFGDAFAAVQAFAGGAPIRMVNPEVWQPPGTNA